MTDAEVAALPMPGGIAGTLATIVDLLEATFGSGSAGDGARP
jgi:hypothetical protein